MYLNKSLLPLSAGWQRVGKGLGFSSLKSIIKPWRVCICVPAAEPSPLQPRSSLPGSSSCQPNRTFWLAVWLQGHACCLATSTNSYLLGTPYLQLHLHLPCLTRPDREEGLHHPSPSRHKINSVSYASKPSLPSDKVKFPLWQLRLPPTSFHHQSRTRPGHRRVCQTGLKIFCPLHQSHATHGHEAINPSVVPEDPPVRSLV